MACPVKEAMGMGVEMAEGRVPAQAASARAMATTQGPRFSDCVQAKALEDSVTGPLLARFLRY